MPKKSCVVYHDPSYATSWVPKSVSQEVSSFLTMKRNRRISFVMKNAREMGNWMTHMVETDSCRGSVVVFSQDVAPDTVLDAAGPDALVRRYLDRGGRIVWLGDVPFWYRGRRNVTSLEELDKTWFLKGAPFQVLGVIPVFSIPLRVVKHRLPGLDLGLRSTWSGLRPIFVKGQAKEGIVTLSSSKGFGKMAIRYPHELPRSWSRFKRLDLGVFSAHVGVEFSPPGEQVGEATRLDWVISDFANAWFKNFNRQRDLSGFYRIWDSPLVAPLSITMLQELYRVATVSAHRWRLRGFPESLVSLLRSHL